MAGPLAALVAVLAALASAAVAATMHFLWHSQLMECVGVGDGALPFLALYLGVLAWLVLLHRPAAAILDGEWQGRVASKLESAGRIMVGTICTADDQHDVQQALTLLQTIFVNICEEHRAGTTEVLASRTAAQRGANEACKLAELSASALAAKFGALALQIGPVFSCRAAHAVEEALDCVPKTSAITTAASNADSKATVAFVAIVLLVFPIYCAAVAKSVLGGAGLALIASIMPVALAVKHFCAISAASQSSNSIESEDVAQRRRLFNLRMTELRSMTECSLPNTPTHSEVPTATTRATLKVPSAKEVKEQRNKVMLKIQSSSQLQNEVTTRDAVSHSSQLLASEAAEDHDHEVPPYTMIGSEVTGPCVTRAVPCSFEKSAAHEGNNGSSGTISRMLGEIGMFDNYAIMQSLGSALSLSTLPANNEQRNSEQRSVSTFQIISSASSAPTVSAASETQLPEPETPNNKTIPKLQHNMPTTPGLTPIVGKGPCSINSNQESLPDVSQAELSQSTCFSLSPGGTAQNMSTVLASPGNIPLHLPLQDENRNHNRSPVGLAKGISQPPTSISQPPTCIQNLSNAVVLLPVKRARPRAFC